MVPASLSPEISANVYQLVQKAARRPDVQAVVEANHDQNRWWPTTVTDPRVRMAVAGWSARVSYTMIDTYSRVVADADALGFDRLVALPTDDLTRLLQPLGLMNARASYLRSLGSFHAAKAEAGDDLLSCDADGLIDRFARTVDHASFKIAQCAVLYSRGYHCGIIPVDSGMVARLGPALGMTLPKGRVAHEKMRQVLQACLADRAEDYRRLIKDHGYAVSLPPDTKPSWWVHLVLIYFKRLYLNRPNPHLCARRPLCDEILDCGHSDHQPGEPARPRPSAGGGGPNVRQT